MRNLRVQKSLRQALLLLSLSFFAMSVYQVSEYWNYTETLADLDKVINTSIQKETIAKEIQQSIDNSNFDDARMYLAIAKSSNLFTNKTNNNNDTSNTLSEFEAEINSKDTALRKFVSQTTKFSNGFFTGKGSNSAGIAGSVASDFTVIGDARDLTEQYIKHQKGESVNELIVLLSGAGVGLTALTIGTRGLASPAKAGTSVIKTAIKTQRVTKNFQKHLIHLGRQVFNWPLFTRAIKKNKRLPNIRKAAISAYNPDAIQPLKSIARQVNSVRKSTSTLDTVHLLKYVDTPRDLIQLEKVSLKYGYKTKGLVKLIGKSALRTVRVLHKTTKLLLAIISSIFSALISLILMFMRRVIV